MFMREVFFSRLHYSGVEDENGRRIGLLHDVAVSLATEYPRVVGIRISGHAYLPIGFLAGGLTGDVLRASSKAVLRELKENECYASELLLDKQVLDRRTKRVRRVNDIVFASYGREDTEEQCFFVGVDVGINGICRRMKAEWLAISQPRLIGWRDIIMVDDGTVPYCLTMREQALSGVSVRDIGEICRSLDSRACRLFLRQLSPAFVCKAMMQMPARERSRLLTAFAGEEAADFVRSLPADMQSEVSVQMPRLYQWCRRAKRAEGGDGT